MHPSKRWVAKATLQSEVWHVEPPRRVAAADLLLNILFEQADRKTVLAGFDFPIGLPAAYGRLTGFDSFETALRAFGALVGWEEFFEVVADSADLCIERPFYPRRSQNGVRQASLVKGLGVGNFDDLYRACERGGVGRRKACSVFWTLGPNQVGKAALTGWREILRPALDRGARLWPFHGKLQHLQTKPGLVIAETYPADAYIHFGAEFGPSESKRRQSDRAGKAHAIWSSASDNGVCLADVQQSLFEGFTSSAGGEDGFDALLGLLQLIEVAKGNLPEARANFSLDQATWEGSIVGR